MNKFYRGVHKALCFLMRILFPWEAEGTQQVPEEGGMVLCGNHTSLLDPLFVLCCVRDKRQLHVMAKAELFRIPVLNWILRKMDMISVKRGKSDISAVKESLRVLRNGELLLIFPEGTRVKENETSEGHTGAVVIAARANVPVMPIYIERRKRMFCKTRIVFGEPYELRYSGKKPTPEESQTLTADLMRRIRALGETV